MTNQQTTDGDQEIDSIRAELSDRKARMHTMSQEAGNLRAELERFKSCDMAHKLEELRQELSSEQRLRERFQIGYEDAVHKLASAREEMGRVKEALRAVWRDDFGAICLDPSDADWFSARDALLGEKAGG